MTPNPAPAPALDPALELAFPLARAFEGFRARPYRDSAGVWTIGYGFTRLAEGTPVSASTKAVTQIQATAYLKQLLSELAENIRKQQPTLTSGQLGALTDFAYNLGLSTLYKSTLWKLLQQGLTTPASNELTRWVHAGGVALPGLLRRRQAEQYVWRTGNLPQAVEDMKRRKNPKPLPPSSPTLTTTSNSTSNSTKGAKG